MLKARIIRFVFALHRWMGVTLGLLMLLWCLSGVVMIWNKMPSMQADGHDLRIEGLAPIRIPDQLVLPQLPPAALVRSARIEMLNDRPVMSFAWQEGEGGGSALFDLVTGAKIKGVSEAEALSIAATYAARHKLAAKPTLIRINAGDEFTAEQRGRRPFYEIALHDPADTVLYISAKSGAVSQQTTFASRLGAWTGAIPHWLYFNILRQDGKLWSQVIIWTSLAGCFLVGLGLFVGIRQFRRRHSTGKHVSPYHGAKFWHHMTGLVFGVLVLTFTFSGFASMNPWGWLESTEASGEAAGRLTGAPVPWSVAGPAFDAQITALRTISRERSQVEYLQLEGKPWFVWHSADGTNRRLDAAGQPAPFDDDARARAVALIGGEKGGAKAEVLTAPDAYYRGDASDFPVVRIDEPGDVSLYLDPDTGDIRTIYDPGSRGYRWWHEALHTFDVIGSPWREIVILLAMLGVTAVCGFGAWLGIAKLLRGGKLDNTPKDQMSA